MTPALTRMLGHMLREPTKTHAIMYSKYPHLRTEFGMLKDYLIDSGHINVLKVLHADTMVQHPQGGRLLFMIVARDRMQSHQFDTVDFTPCAGHVIAIRDLDACFIVTTRTTSRGGRVYQ